MKIPQYASAPSASRVEELHTWLADANDHCRVTSASPMRRGHLLTFYHSQAPAKMSKNSLYKTMPTKAYLLVKPAPRFDLPRQPPAHTLGKNFSKSSLSSNDKLLHLERTA
jgi:hypothetical protein